MSAASSRRRTTFARCSRCARRRFISVPAASSLLSCRSRFCRAGNSKGCAPARSCPRELPGMKSGQWTIASSHCFRCPPGLSSGATSKPLPDKVRAYTGTLPFRDAPEDIADRRLNVRDNAPALDIAAFEGGSPYRKMFCQGATLVPRMLCFVERKAMGRLGADPSAPYVASRRTNQEKEPWKSLPGIENRVEAEFLRPVLLGESILPYRIFQPFDAVVPVMDKGEVLDAEAAANRGFDCLHGWMKKAEKQRNSASARRIPSISRPMGCARFRQGHVQPADPALRRQQSLAQRPRQNRARGGDNRRIRALARERKISTRARPCPRGADRSRRGAKNRRAGGKASRRRVSRR